MTSYSGSVAYLEYQSRTNKGDVKRGDVFNSVFGLGKMDEARMNFTSQVIIETVEAGSGSGSSDAAVMLHPMHFENGCTCYGGKGFLNKADGKYYDAKITRNGEVLYADVVDGAIEGLAAGDKVAYFSEEFQMEHVPAQDIPTLGPVMKHIPLVAEPRRIAVRYDQITAFQA